MIEGLYDFIFSHGEWEWALRLWVYSKKREFKARPLHRLQDPPVGVGLQSLSPCWGPWYIRCFICVG